MSRSYPATVPTAVPPELTPVQAETLAVLGDLQRQGKIRTFGCSSFPAEEIVIVTHPGEERNWAEEDLLEQAQGRFSVPVRQVEMGGS